MTWLIGTQLATVAVIAKEPLPGKVKTRLICAAVTARDAASLAEASLRDTLRALSGVDAANRVIVLDGRPGEWLPDGWTVRPQRDGGLDSRLAAAFAGFSAGPALLVGMDTPQLSAEDLRFDPDSYDACLGLASDGGFWCVGFADPGRAAALIAGVPMSRPDTGQRQLARLRAAGLRVQQLPVLTDVDTYATACEVARADPTTEFAERWQGLSRVLAGRP